MATATNPLRLSRLPGFFLVVLFGTTGCGSLPTIVPDLAQHADTRMQLKGSQGPLSVVQSKVILGQTLSSGEGQRGTQALGTVHERDLAALYSGAACVVVPSRYEGFGLPVLEAMACGAPVLCSSAAPLPEVAGDAAVLFDPRAGGRLALELSRVLASPALRDELRARGVARAREFSWDRTAIETVAVYRRLAG